MKKNILFLSSNDFKEKSIQIIRNTPLAYRDAGWNVEYIVMRDNSRSGSYFYESPMNLDGIHIIRKKWPFVVYADKFKGSFFKKIVRKVAGIFTSFILFYEAKKIIKNNRFDVIYGYEYHGIIASYFLRIFYKKYVRDSIFISRYQGTWLQEYLDKKKYHKLIFNLDQIASFKMYHDLCIMTDDGTRGDQFYNRIIGNKDKLKFWTNGVNITSSNKKTIECKDKVNLISISRLHCWKRVDRSIAVVDELVNNLHLKNIKLTIIGEGSERKNLEKKVELLGLKENIDFIGAVNNQEIEKLLAEADIFLSFYELSNVGNPLLEAISGKKFIFTLNNGDTGKWISHMKNGFIYNEEEPFYRKCAEDIQNLISDKDLQDKIFNGVNMLSLKKLWSWENRMNEEVQVIEKALLECNARTH